MYWKPDCSSTNPSFITLTRSPHPSASHPCGPLGPSSVTMERISPQTSRPVRKQRCTVTDLQLRLMNGWYCLSLASTSSANCWHTVKMTVTEEGDLEECKGGSCNWPLKERKVELLFYPLLSDCRKSVPFLKVPRLRPFDFLLRAECR